MVDGTLVDVAVTTKGITMEDAYIYWLAAFQHKVKKKQYTQIELVDKIKEEAPGVKCTKGHLNAVYKARTNKRGQETRASSDLQQAIAKCYDCNYMEFIGIGRSIVEGIPIDKEQPPKKKDKAYTPEKSTVEEQGSYLDVMTSVGRLVCATQKTEDRLLFWREMFGMLPVPALIIREGSVIYQNELSIVMGGDISGKDICALCIGGGCESKDECPAHIANKNTNPTTGYRTIRGIRYKISVSHVRLNEMNYFIVLITSVRDEEV